jgi:hypothetical protein
MPMSSVLSVTWNKKCVFVLVLLCAFLLPASAQASTGTDSKGSGIVSSKWSFSGLLTMFLPMKDDRSSVQEGDWNDMNTNKTNKDFTKWCKESGRDCPKEESYDIWKQWFCD